MNRRSMVGPMLQRLKALHRSQPGEPLRLVTVDQIVMPDELPDAGPAWAAPQAVGQMLPAAEHALP